jgi:hypothetical protein
MTTTYYLRSLNPDGSVRETFTASSVKALAATIYEISTRRALGDSDELATAHRAPSGRYVSTQFDVARVVDGEPVPGLTDAEQVELDAEIARRSPPDERPAWIGEPLDPEDNQ